MIILICILLNIYFLIKTVKLRQINSFFILFLASQYYIVVIPIMGIYGYPIFGFLEESKVWEKYIYIGSIYNLAMYMAMITKKNFKIITNSRKKKPNLNIVKLTVLTLIVIYSLLYINTGTLFFNNYKFLNVLATLLVISTLILFPAKKYLLIIPSIIIIILIGFRAKIILIFSGLITNILKSKYYLIILIPAAILASYIFENIRQYGASFNKNRLNQIFENLNLDNFVNIIVNQGEATVSLYSSIILSSNLFYENFLDPYIYAINKFLFMDNIKNPNEILTKIEGFDYANSGFAFNHFVELYLQGGILTVFIGSYLYGLFFKHIELYIKEKFIEEYSKYLITFFAIFFGFYNYSRGHFFQIFTDLIVIFLFLYIITFRLKKKLF